MFALGDWWRRKIPSSMSPKRLSAVSPRPNVRADGQRLCLKSQLNLGGGIGPILPRGVDTAHTVGQRYQDRPTTGAADVKFDDAFLVLAEADDFFVEHLGQFIDRGSVGPRLRC